MVQWTRQVKELLLTQDATIDSADLGLLDEINFWARATAELQATASQLERADVARVVRVLEAADSSYLKGFGQLREKVKHRCEEASSNHKFLSLLTESCEALADSGPKTVTSLLPDMLKTIRVIWSISKFYNTAERLTTLLRKLSTEIISRCQAHLSVEALLGADLTTSMDNLPASIRCGTEWKVIFRRTVRAIAKTVRAVSTVVQLRGERRPPTIAALLLPHRRRHAATTTIPIPIPIPDPNLDPDPDPNLNPNPTTPSNAPSNHPTSALGTSTRTRSFPRSTRSFSVAATFSRCARASSSSSARPPTRGPTRARCRHSVARTRRASHTRSSACR